MALFDFLKRKKEVEKSKKEKKPAKVSVEKKVKAVKPEKIAALDEKKKEGSVQTVSPKSTAKHKDFSYQVVREPHISEKATYLAEDNKYVFKVYPNTNKFEIKKSVEGIYKVDVLSVNIIKIPGKKRRIGRTEGFKKGHTKAVVTIKEGQKIEVY